MSEMLASFYFQAECWHLKLISGQLMFETQFSWPMAPLIADHPYSVTFHDLSFIEWNCVEAIYICMCIDLPWWSGYLSGLH